MDLQEYLDNMIMPALQDALASLIKHAADLKLADQVGESNQSKTPIVTTYHDLKRFSPLRWLAQRMSNADG